MAFSIFLVGAAGLFLILAVTTILIQENLLKEGKQNRWDDFLVTFMLGYAYVRMLLHILTSAQLERSSLTFQSFPANFASDNAFMIIDALTFFFWVPVTLYGIVQALLIANGNIYNLKIAPVQRVMISTYLVDRILQQMLSFNLARFVHHVVAASLVLFVLEWYPALSDPSFLSLALIEVLPRLEWFWMAGTRFSHQHAKSVISVEIQGVDCLFIWTNPKSAARCGRFVFWYSVFASAVSPITFFTAYSLRVGGNIPQYWKYAFPILLVAFHTVDYPLRKRLWDLGCTDYWKNKVLLKTKSEHETIEMTEHENEIEATEHDSETEV
jgi:hypothetical protein